MSDEKRKDEQDEVEAHGPRNVGQTEEPADELEDDEVEAHGPRNLGPRNLGPRNI